MTTPLDEILETTRRGLAPLRARARELAAAARAAPPPRSWLAAFTERDVAVVAEVKRRSPSAGVIAPHLDPARRAAAYVAGGARAVSVLTEPAFFDGSLADLRCVANVVNAPVLRKDFIVDPVQLYEARLAGASAVLLIVRALDPSQLVELAGEAASLGLGRLVEVHEAHELEWAMRVEPETVGVNSRDLRTLEVDVAGTREVLRLVPPGVVAVAESGLGGRRDVERVAAWGADAVLVGTALSRDGAPERAVRSLCGVPRRRRDAA
jgi:indole-3-glycerol phosphate synthase